jgi:hypothetical protein
MASCWRGWANGETEFWHTNCEHGFVARALQKFPKAWTAADAVSLNLLMTRITLAGQRIPSRIRKIATLRRRLPVTIFPPNPQPVIIRHILQNLGSAAGEVRAVQSPPA